MEFIFSFIFGFFIIYYITFCTALLYTAIIEEWCCRNRIPEWNTQLQMNASRLRERYNRIKERYNRMRGYTIVSNQIDENL